MKFNTGEVIALVNSIHSLEGSDVSHLPAVQSAISFCRKRVLKLTGRDPIQFPANMQELIEHLKEVGLYSGKS